MSIETKVPTGDDLLAEIDRLRKERNAVILAHYYQTPDIQDIADFVGDSLELSRKAADTDRAGPVGVSAKTSSSVDSSSSSE